MPMTTAYPSTIFLWLHQYCGCSFSRIKIGYTPFVLSQSTLHSVQPLHVPNLSTFQYLYLCIYL